MKRKITKDEELILREILKKCKWKERILVKTNTDFILNIYHQGRIEIINVII